MASAMSLKAPMARSGAVSVGRSGPAKVRTAVMRPSLARRTVVPSTNASAAIDVSTMTDAQRAEFAEQMGYERIGKELPDDVRLKDIVDTLPKEVFELNEAKAWSAVAISIFSMAACLALISVTPWYLLPFSWFLTGTAFTGFFVVGHDCGHRTFSKNRLLEDIVGTLMFAPLIYPFEPWRIKHNQHHAFTNKLVDDTAWHPVMKEEFDQLPGWAQAINKFFLGTPLKLWASVGHWALWHFDLKKYKKNEQTRVIVSLAAVFAFMATAFPFLLTNFGVGGFVKYWLMPWLGYHFWMSTFTVVHHTAPFIPFKEGDDWNAAKAQLSGTVHCEFPAWVEFLTHDISVHVGHHVNTRIPWYNLRPAYNSLIENWGEYMCTCTFNWRMMKNIFTECHFYDKENNYVPFDEKKPEGLFEAQRKLLPNSM